MAAGSLLHLALAGDRNTTVSAGRCKRVRFRKDDCRICADVCPEAAVSLNPGPGIGSGCSDCGLCRSACPTDAFRDERNPDRRMLDQARSLLADYPPPNETRRLSIRCRRAHGGSGRSLVVSCLGSVTENVLLGAAISGFDEVRLTKGTCEECRLRQGEALFAHSVATARKLLEGMGFQRISLSVEERGGGDGDGDGKEEALTRREVFSVFSRKAMDKATDFLHHREKALRERFRDGLGDAQVAETGTIRSRRREFLLALLRREGGAPPGEARARAELPWKKMAVDGTKCLACGTCHMLCPTGAVAGRTEDGLRRLYFIGSSCTNCFICREACPERAIEFREHQVLSDLLHDDAEIVAEVAPTSCRSCGEEIPSGKGEVCPTCRWRLPDPVREEPRTGRCADVPG